MSTNTHTCTDCHNECPPGQQFCLTCFLVMEVMGEEPKMEEHVTLCSRCGEEIGPCEEPGCIMRYAHYAGLCALCQEEAEKREWAES